VIRELDQWLATLFDEEHLDHTCEVLSGATEPDPAGQRREAAIRAAIVELTASSLHTEASSTTTPSRSPPSGSPKPNRNGVPSKRRSASRFQADS